MFAAAVLFALVLGAARAQPLEPTVAFLDNMLAGKPQISAEQAKMVAGAPRLRWAWRRPIARPPQVHARPQDRDSFALRVLRGSPLACADPAPSPLSKTGRPLALTSSSLAPLPQACGTPRR